MHEDEQPSENDDAMLVNQSALSNAIEAVSKETPVEELVFIETEPLLSAYCRAELFQILGKLSVAGASSGVVRGVGADVHRLIRVTATAMRTGYCTLLEDFLPEFAPSAADVAAQSTEEDETGTSPGNE